jgi:chromosome segregation ATPase
MNDPNQPAGQPTEAKVEQKKLIHDIKDLFTSFVGIEVWQLREIEARLKPILATSEARAVADATHNLVLAGQEWQKELSEQYDKLRSENAELRAQLEAAEQREGQAEARCEKLDFALNYLRLPLKIDPSISNEDAKLLTAFQDAFDTQEAALAQASLRIEELQKYQSDPGWCIAENRDLKNKLREAQADSKRLDWLCSLPNREVFVSSSKVPDGYGGTKFVPIMVPLERAAIDAAMSQQPGGK